MNQKILFSLLFLLLSACQTKTVHTTPGTIKPQPQTPMQNQSGTIQPKGPSAPMSDSSIPTSNHDYNLEAETPSTETATPGTLSPSMEGTAPVIPLTKLPKIGLILGPGGAKTFAHIGVLQEFQKAKIPIHAISGLEFAAPMAALFAWKGYVNDVEWQMSKLKDEDIVKKAFISTSKSAEMSNVKDFMRTVFHNLKVENLKKPFGCPALNLSKNQIYMMSRGTLEQLLPYCWPYPPLFRPYKNNVSGVRDLKITADFLRSQGAQYIILVNVLGGDIHKKPIPGGDNLENLLWSELATSYSRPQAGIDAMISLNLENYGIMDLGQKREVMQKGSDLSTKQIQALSQRLGY